MYIYSTGIVCSVGLNSAAACAAMRAGVAGFQELGYHDNQGEPVVGAVVPGMDTGLSQKQRLVELLTQALAECAGQETRQAFETIPLLIGLAESGRPGGSDRYVDTILDDVQTRLGISFHPTLSQALQKGHTAGFEALGLASELLESGQATACLICGVDSFANGSSLQWLDKFFRLKTSSNSDGVIPGEAAAAVLVRPLPSPSGSPVQVAGFGFGFEEVNILSEEPFRGLGLAEAARNALQDARMPMNEMAFRLSDATGESYGFKELSLTLSRVLRQGPSELPLWHCADSIGDVGAAAGLCQLIRGADALVQGYAPGNTAIAFASNVPGDRAAVVLRMEGDMMPTGVDTNQQGKNTR